MGCVHDGRMKTIMRLEYLTVIEPLTEFLSGTQAVAYPVISDEDDGYRWMQKVRSKFHYLT